MFLNLSKLKEFDYVTKFRLINAISIFFILGMLDPLIVDLQGELLTVNVITFFMILGVVGVKFQKVLVTYSMSTLYKMGVIFQPFLLGTLLLYFYDTKLFILTLLTLKTIEVIIFGALTIKFDEYLSKHYHNMFSKFKVYRNSIISDITLVAFFLTLIITHFFSKAALVVFVFSLLFLFCLYLVYNFNYFDKYGN